MSQMVINSVLMTIWFANMLSGDNIVCCKFHLFSFKIANIYGVFHLRFREDVYNSMRSIIFNWFFFDICLHRAQN